MRNASVAALSLMAFAAPALPAAPTESPATIEVEKIGSRRYILHLAGSDWKNVDAGRALLVPKANELCPGQPYRFGRYRLSQDFTFSGDEMVRRYDFTQNLHCGDLRPDFTAKASWVEEADEQAVMDDSDEYFRLREAGRYREAYKFAGASFQETYPFQTWLERVRGFHDSAGELDYRRVYRIHWHKKSRDALARVELDFVGGFEDSKVLCTHLVWDEQPDGSFVLSREKEYHTSDREEHNRWKPRPNVCPEASGS